MPYHRTLVQQAPLLFPVGFDLGSTIQSKTKGIWAWVRPHSKLPDCCMVLLDTEGLGDVEKVFVHYVFSYVNKPSVLMTPSVRKIRGK